MSNEYVDISITQKQEDQDTVDNLADTCKVARIYRHTAYKYPYDLSHAHLANRKSQIVGVKVLQGLSRDDARTETRKDLPVSERLMDLQILTLK